jgi:hypothetical protein
MKGKLRNEWIVVDGFKMYVRKSKRFYDNKFVDCLDIASMEAEVQGTGIFTKILTKILSDYPKTNIFVESILNPRLKPFLEKFGFIEYRTDDMILIRN